MTATQDTQFGQTKLPLGVGKIIGDSVSILFRKFVTVILVSIGPMALGLLISGLLVGWAATFQAGDMDPTELAELMSGGAYWARFGLSMVLQMVIYGFTTALLVKVAYDAKLNQSHSIGEYFAPALRAAIPVAILMIVTVFLSTLGGIAFLIGALWVYAVFSVTTPAIVIEGVGFRGMGRSAALTKEYRWPIAGALFLIILITLLFSMAVQFVTALFAAQMIGNGIGIVLLVVVMGVLQSITLGLSSITSALIFARLKEIKEGVGVDRLAAVFE